MRRLFELLASYGNLFLFLGLQGLSLILLFQFNNRHQLLYNAVAQSVLGGIQEVNSDVDGYFDLGVQNEQLLQENMALRMELARTRNELAEVKYRVPLKGRFSILPDSLLPAYRYRFIPCRAISNSTVGDYNYVTLNKGSRHGIHREMGLLSATGVVGLVVAVSENYSVAMSLLNKDFRLSARIRTSEVFGTIQWEGGSSDHASLLYVPQHFQVAVGDTVVASGHSTLFPEGIIIGTVSEVKPNDQGSFHDITVKLTADFHRLNYLYVVEHENRIEIDSLQRTVSPSTQPRQ